MERQAPPLSIRNAGEKYECDTVAKLRPARKAMLLGGDDLIAAAIRLCTPIPGLPQRALAREALIAQVEISRLLRATIRDLERRAKRGKR